MRLGRGEKECIIADIYRALDYGSFETRVPRKWNGREFTEREIPVVVVSASNDDAPVVFSRVGQIASRYHLATMQNKAHRNGHSEILVYAFLKESEVPVSDTADVVPDFMDREVFDSIVRHHVNPVVGRVRLDPTDSGYCDDLRLAYDRIFEDMNKHFAKER